MKQTDFEKARQVGADETENAIIVWLRSQVAEARAARRSYLATWLERVAQAIERGEHRNRGGG